MFCGNICKTIVELRPATLLVCPTGWSCLWYSTYFWIIRRIETFVEIRPRKSAFVTIKTYYLELVCMGLFLRQGLRRGHRGVQLTPPKLEICLSWGGLNPLLENRTETKYKLANKTDDCMQHPSREITRTARLFDDDFTVKYLVQASRTHVHSLHCSGVLAACSHHDRITPLHFVSSLYMGRPERAGARVL